MNRKRFRKRNFRTLMTSPVTFVVLLILFVLIGRAALNINGKRLETKENLARVQNEYAELEERLTDLEQDVMYIKSEKGVEAELRTRYGVAKPGERVVVIVEDEEVAPPQEQAPKRSWWKKILDFLNPF